VGESPHARRLETDVKTLIMQAVVAAADDAGIDLSEIDGIVTESAVTPDMMTPDEVAANLGLQDHRFVVQTGSAGAGLAAAPMLAAMAIASGFARTVLCYFGVDWGSNRDAVYGWHADPYHKSLEMPFAFYGQPVYFATTAQRYMHEYCLTSRQLGSLAVSTRDWAAKHPRAQMQNPITLDDYEKSPIVADPLRVLDCCLLTDGAGAFIMTSADRARDLRQPAVLAAGFSFSAAPWSRYTYVTQHQDFLDTQARFSAPRALQMAGIGIDAVQFAEVYDCFTITCLLQLESVGFCKRGEGGAFVEDGRTGPGGELPVNTHGGLLSHGYLLGVAHIIEAVHQLRGHAGERQVTDAQVGLVSGWGMREHTTLVLTR
jgi:acetyl-CoA acetyltransferase